jgi:hypothetical protein
VTSPQKNWFNFYVRVMGRWEAGVFLRSQEIAPDLKIFGGKEGQGGIPGRDLPRKKMVLTKKWNPVPVEHK